jgi:hypothetical protein
MVAKVKRKIRSKTARAMLTWAHYRFKLTLRHQAEITGATVVDVTEEYTSKHGNTVVMFTLRGLQNINPPNVQLKGRYLSE